MKKSSRALLTVSDKTGIVSMAKNLVSLGWEIISTGGTGKVLSEAGVLFTEISRVTGNPEAFGGRVKTLSFQIESAILYDRDRDREEAAKLGIFPIDLVVCNLYPFRQVWERKADFDTLIENIDIGGPTLIRSAAKNFKHVGVVTNPGDYDRIAEELRANKGSLTLGTKQILMRKAFALTADYDADIATALEQQENLLSLRMTFSEGKALRYGENAHQKAWVFRPSSAPLGGRTGECFGPTPGLLSPSMNILHGKELSYNNYLDIQGAISAVKELERPGCAVIKHTNPCGLAETSDLRSAFEAAWKGDPVSAFGSIISFNRRVKRDTVEFLDFRNPDKSKRKFVEIILAPEFDPDSIEYLKDSKNLRIIEFAHPEKPPSHDFRFVDGLLLQQEVDDSLFETLESKTGNKLDDEARGLACFGIKASRLLKSNAIVVVREVAGKGYQMLGMGAGQPNRLVSTRLAVTKCRENLAEEAAVKGVDTPLHFKKEMERAILVSDGFFPFPDSVDECANAGIKTIVQPGGSIRDDDVIRRSAELGITMIFTGTRHFKH